jgi:feruloyl esterase
MELPAYCRRFDPATLLCRSSDADDCLTASQVEAVKMAYAPARKSTGQVVFPGLPPGGELGWQMLAGKGPSELSLGTFSSVLYQDPKWDWRNFDLDRDTALTDEKFGYMDAIAPDLTAFKARGGKLLMYHGWNDPMISALNSIDYYSSVLAKMGQDQSTWLRLFMVPGEH